MVYKKIKIVKIPIIICNSSIFENKNFHNNVLSPFMARKIKIE